MERGVLDLGKKSPDSETSFDEAEEKAIGYEAILSAIQTQAPFEDVQGYKREPLSEDPDKFAAQLDISLTRMERFLEAINKEIEGQPFETTDIQDFLAVLDLYVGNAAIEDEDEAEYLLDKILGSLATNSTIKAVEMRLTSSALTHARRRAVTYIARLYKQRTGIEVEDQPSNGALESLDKPQMKLVLNLYNELVKNDNMPEELIKKQERCFRLYIYGMEWSEIAKKLEIDVETAKAHVKTIIDKISEPLNARFVRESEPALPRDDANDKLLPVENETPEEGTAVLTTKKIARPLGKVASDEGLPSLPASSSEEIISAPFHKQPKVTSPSNPKNVQPKDFSSQASRLLRRIDPDHKLFSAIGEDEIRALLDLYGRLSPLAQTAETSKKDKELLEEEMQDTFDHLMGRMWTSIVWGRENVSHLALSKRYTKLVNWLHDELQRIDRGGGIDALEEKRVENINKLPLTTLEALNLSTLENHLGITKESVSTKLTPQLVIDACDRMAQLIGKAEERDSKSLKYDMQIMNAPSKEQLNIVWSLLRSRMNSPKPFSRDEFVEGYRQHHGKGVKQVLIGESELNRRTEQFGRVVDEAIQRTLQWMIRPEYENQEAK